MHVFGRRRRSASAVGLVLLVSAAVPGMAFAQAKPSADGLAMISSQGARLVDPAGCTVILKGCNLGNWFMLESWMLGGCLQDGGQNYRDQASLYRDLQSRFGSARCEQLIDLWRDGYITARDFDQIKSFGMNVVRLPFDYRLLQSDQPPYDLKPNAFRWLDHALQLAEAAHVYVILDLHGTPGGQSGQDHTGEAGQNHLWHNDMNKRRTVELWRAIAQRYKDRSVVAAYDLINEPYGDYHTDERPELAVLMPQILRAIRSTGDHHVVFFAGALNGGIGFYGNPHDQGFDNVGFTEHSYAGLFGSKPALETQARVLNQQMPMKAAYVDRLGVPYFLGEFNVVLSSEWPQRLMRAYYDFFAQHGWAGTMWSYKLLKPAGGAANDGWYLVTNADSLPTLDVRTSSYQDIASFFASFGTMRLTHFEPMRQMLTTATPPPLHLSTYPALPTTAPTDAAEHAPKDYTSVDLGSAALTPGYTTTGEDHTLTIGAGGSDIGTNSDSCRFVSQAVHGDSDTAAQIISLLNSAEYAKAGVMARWGDGAGAAMAMVNVFPDGTVAFMSRPKAGARSAETKLQAGLTLPVQLRLNIATGRASGYYRDDAGQWRLIGTAVVPATPDYRTGLAVCSHVDAALTVAKVRLGVAPLPSVAELATDSLLENGSFSSNGGSLPAGWSGWGSASCNGSAVSWALGRGAGIWQDVVVEPGQRYIFAINARRGGAADDQLRSNSSSVELRLESSIAGEQVTVNSQSLKAANLTAGTAWTRLSVSGTAASDKLRVLVVGSSSADADADAGGGTVQWSNASLKAVPQR